MTLLRTLAALASLLAAPAALAFDPSGEVTFGLAAGLGGSASFDGERVVGPAVNVSREDGAGWAGDIRGGDMVLEVTATRLKGAGVSIALDRKPGELHVEGILFGQRVRLELKQKTFTGRYGSCSFDLHRKGPGFYRGEVGCMREGTTIAATASATMRLTGEADTPEPPLPQMALALLAILPN